jgi:hypothetical protein
MVTERESYLGGLVAPTRVEFLTPTPKSPDQEPEESHRGLTVRSAEVRTHSNIRWAGGACTHRPDERGLHGSTRLGQAAARKAAAWSATHWA